MKLALYVNCETYVTLVVRMPQKVSEIGWPTYKSVMKNSLIINHELNPNITEETEL